MLSDLTDELIWPRVLRAPALAIAPNRLVSGCIGALLIALILNVYAELRSLSGGESAEGTRASERIATGVGAHAQGILDALVGLRPMDLTLQIKLAAEALRDAVMHSPLLTLLLGIPLVLVLGLVGGSISRSVAFEFAQGRYATREETVQFTLRRTRQFVGALMGPVLFSSLLAFVIALGGLLLSFPIIDIFGGLLYPVALALGALASIVLILHVIALPMIVPALSVEGTDAFDAIQRCYAYVIGRPIRYFAYTLLLSIVGFVAATVFAMLAALTQEMTDWSLNYFFSHATESALTGEGDLGATKAFAHGTIEAFRGVLRVIVAGYGVSLFYSSGTLLYLATRRICDGQGISEIWEPVGEG